MKKRKRERTTPKILLFLAQKKPASKWEIAKVLNKSYGNIYATIQQLLNRNLIKIEYKKPSAKNPKIEVEYYSITILGLFEVINSFSPKELDGNMDVIAKKHADKLPLVFGKWEHFSKHGFREQAILNLTTIPKAYLLRAEFASSSKLPQYSTRLEQGITHTFCFGELRIMHFYDIPPSEFLTLEDLEFHSEEAERIERWIRMLMMDSDLREYVKKEFRWLIGSVSKYMNALKKFRRLTMKD